MTEFRKLLLTIISKQTIYTQRALIITDGIALFTSIDKLRLTIGRENKINEGLLNLRDSIIKLN